MTTKDSADVGVVKCVGKEHQSNEDLFETRQLLATFSLIAYTFNCGLFVFHGPKRVTAGDDGGRGAGALADRFRISLVETSLLRFI